MKGNNTITINQATMVEAIDHYFRTVLFVEGKAPKVASVEAQRQTFGSGETFDVKVEERAAPPGVA